MKALFYIIDDENPQNRREFDRESMQEFVINNALLNKANFEGEFRLIDMPIIIKYSALDGEVRLVGIEEGKSISFDFTNAFQVHCQQVEEAIRRLAKLELLIEMHEMEDTSVCELIKKNHGKAATGKICEHTSELELDMTLVRVIKLGYPHRRAALLGIIFFIVSDQKPTQTQKAIYAAFEDFKKLSSGPSHGLEQIKSINAAQKFKNLIIEHLEKENAQIPLLKMKKKN